MVSQPNDLNLLNKIADKGINYFSALDHQQQHSDNQVAHN